VDVAELADESRLMFTVREIHLDFLRVARLSDNLEVSVSLTRARRVSVELEQTVTLAGEVLCTAQVRLACVDVDSLKPKPIPDGIRKEL
jgi:acyl-CoA thioester hydrolase